MNFPNPAGLNGFDFLEFTTPDPQKLINQFQSMGFTAYAKHKKHDITIYRQQEILFIINNTLNTRAQAFAKQHGASACAMGFRVNDATLALQHALKQGAKLYQPDASKEAPAYEIPAIYGVGDSLIYFVDYQNNQPNYANEFNYLDGYSDETSNENVGLTYIDHVTHNLHRGNMITWANFYTQLFNFREIRHFDIEGTMTGLKSKAMTSPCGKIRIPLNESSDNQSQIEEFLQDFNGEGIQHIALGTNNIYDSVKSLQNRGLAFLDTPDTYYDLIEKRLPKHGEPLELMKQHRILIDGDTKTTHKILLQIFTKNMLGPVFFEIIQRKGDEGFGEGNFRALFVSIELDQIQRGFLTPDKEMA